MMQFCCPLVLGDEDGTGYYSRTGTATLLRYKKRQFVVTAKHCLEGFNPNQVRIFAGSNPTHNTALKSQVFVTNQPEEEIDDVIVFEVDDASTTDANVNFFNLITGTSTRERLTSFIVAYPRRENDMNYDEPHIKGHCLVHPCGVNAMFSTDIKHYKQGIFSSPLKNHPDGISGGAVFSIVGQLGSFEVEYEGMIVRAGRKHVHFIEKEFVFTMLDSTF